MSILELLPAVDVKDGRAVRLVQGELARESVYGSPLEVALDFQNSGAQWLHLVDLDAAFGRGENSALLADVVGRLDIDVELSGGIRDDESLTRALATGCRRVNLGTAALENPEWTSRIIAEHGDRIAVGLDVRGHVLAARGWTQEGGDLFETLAPSDIFLVSVFFTINPLRLSAIQIVFWSMAISTGMAKKVLSSMLVVVLLVFKFSKLPLAPFD
jgi:phosphoribosylformimino-5-aminoimidazole carboxamide ribotide isomerase/phosphoribosylanthranilate isomerase